MTTLPDGVLAPPSIDVLLAEIQALVRTYRDCCLWFLAPDFVPESPEQATHVLSYIERYGDRRAYTRARELRQWLSRTSSEISAV